MIVPRRSALLPLRLALCAVLALGSVPGRAAETMRTSGMQAPDPLWPAAPIMRRDPMLDACRVIVAGAGFGGFNALAAGASGPWSMSSAA
ncbi:hypothetical protein [Methylobacterium platani]|uniref:Uncharacterized protein n=1 Tax=Methylobacterium platani TaxID=427683 RepID=A0A179SF21_9HYPH|nr:hypothetical protein [Methylobacterium platani]OAS25473.1 hypothetical protein A5481_08905 [Methylobacterium platani]